MAQVCVVNCSFCETFQGQQVKKGKKWTCKMCGEKQSFRKVFAQGSGKECRQVVQKLNMISGNLKRQMLEGETQESIQGHNNETMRDNDDIGKEESSSSSSRANLSSESKWNQFVSTVSSDATESEELDVLGDYSNQSNGNEGSFTTERGVTFNKYKAQKRKKPMKDVLSNDLNENQQRKTKKMTYPLCKLSKTNQTHLESLDHDVSGDSPPRLSIGPQEKETAPMYYGHKDEPVIQTQTCSATKTCSSTKLSKWSKYS